MLAQVEDVKPKLGIDIGDESMDALITSALAGANARVLDRCGYSENGKIGYVEYRENERDWRTYTTELRPITNLTVEARYPFDTEFAPLQMSVDNPDEGRVTIIGEFDLAFMEARALRGLRPVDWEWPIVKYTYDVTAVAGVVDANELAALKDAVSSYTAWLVERALARGATQQQIGVVRKVLDENDEPDWIWLPIARHIRRTGDRAEWV